jgi:hypothetical protein
MSLIVEASQSHPKPEDRKFSYGTAGVRTHPSLMSMTMEILTGSAVSDESVRPPQSRSIPGFSLLMAMPATFSTPSFSVWAS